MNTRDDYDGIINKPEMEEVLYHAGLHKYIDKYLGKNGKWVYVYNNTKKNVNNAMTTAKRTANNVMNKLYDHRVREQRRKAHFNAEDVSVERYTMRKNGKKYLVVKGYTGGSGKANHKSGQAGSKFNLSSVNQGRARVAKKGLTIKGYKGNLRQKGHSDSKTSGQDGYTGYIDQARRRAEAARKRNQRVENLKELANNKPNNRVRSRKVSYVSGSGSVKRNGKGFKTQAAERRQLINGLKAGRSRRMKNSSPMKAGRVRVNKLKAAERARAGRKAK